MNSINGTKIAGDIKNNVEAMERVCMGVDEETASRRPADRWSPKEIISHLCGREGLGLLPVFRAFVEQDTPELDLHPEDPFFSDARSRMTFKELLEIFRTEYARLAEFVSTLTEEQLGRKAHVPALKKAPTGEYPSLAGFLGLIAEHHLEFHINHMKEILQALGSSR